MPRTASAVRSAALFLAAAIALGACAMAPNRVLRTTAAPADTPLHTDATPTLGHPNEFANRAGFNPGAGILWMNDAERQQELDSMAATGARWIALDFDWNSIQGDGPNSFRWDRATDTVVREARERGLNIVGTLAYSPPWARRAVCAQTSHCFPTDPTSFATFARASAARYGTTSAVPDFRNSVRVWQIWNEPNHYPFVQPTVDVAGYTVMLQQAYAAIKNADPGATVLAGATSPAPDDPSGRDVAPVTFLRGIYANGGGASFDALSHHPYSFPDSPLTDAPWNAFTQTRDLHDVLVEHGHGDRKVWGTESGAATGSGSKAVTDARQAQLLRDYYAGWNGAFRSFTGPLLWFSVRDASTDPGSIYENFGILRHDFSPKPARSALISILHS